MHRLALCSSYGFARIDSAPARSGDTAITSRFRFRCLLLSVCLLCLPALAGAQQPASPDNNTCESAQVLDGSSLPVTLDGTLDSSVSPDVDFFRVEGLTPASSVIVDLTLGEGNFSGKLLGVFDSGCNLLATNDDWGRFTGVARIYEAVPADGKLILAVTGDTFDSEFLGGGTGPYHLTVSQGQGTIVAIHGKVVDAVSGKPISGSAERGASVELFFCDELSCVSLGGSPLDDQGRFRFDHDDTGRPLFAGQYFGSVGAEQYEQGQGFDLGQVLAGEDRDAGVIRLRPNPIQVRLVTPCQNLPATGGKCEYTVNIRNAQRNAFKGLAWTNVSASGTGSFVDQTYFTADKAAVCLASANRTGSQRNFRFSFNVPAKVADFATICADSAWVGQTGKNPYFNTVGGPEFIWVFCMQKDPAAGGSFRVLSQEESRALQRRLHDPEVEALPQFSRKLGRNLLSGKLSEMSKAPLRLHSKP